MRSFRIIPTLLLRGGGFYKTIRFDSPKYVGDSTNTLKLFNDKEVDEILIFDIEATKKKQGPRFELIEELASECFMPLCYGGGIRNLNDIEKLFYAGVEKVSLGYNAFHSPTLISQAAKIFGNQSIVVCADYRQDIWGRYKVAPHGKKTSTGLIEFLKQSVELGAGEIILNDVDRDGTYRGLNQSLIREAAESVQVPLIACGGAKSLSDIVSAAAGTGAQAVAAGSLFVYYGNEKSVLINYPTENEVMTLLTQEKKV
jgi:imidazole glycerol-phosphate synthase subunit HisF